MINCEPEEMGFLTVGYVGHPHASYLQPPNSSSCVKPDGLGPKRDLKWVAYSRQFQVTVNVQQCR